MSAAPAPEAWQALLAALRAAPWSHDLRAALRVAETQHPGLPRLGQALRPQHEPLRLAQAPELDFAPAELAWLDADGAGVPRLAVRSFGLLGPQGPMPLHLTEYVRERLHSHGDAAPARFLDLFHHRMLLLLYRAWAQAQPVVQRDRPAEDRYAAWLGATVGLPAGTRGRAPSASQLAMLSQAGLLGARSRHPEGLVKLLAQHFGVPVQLQSHVPHWLELDPQDRTRLGHAASRRERNRMAPACLGRDAVAGRRVWDRQHRFRIVLGPLAMARHDDFLPGGPAWRALGDCVRLYTGSALRWDLELRLADAERPAPRLADRPRLGVDTWLGSKQPRRARQHLRLRPDTHFMARRLKDPHHG